MKRKPINFDFKSLPENIFDAVSDSSMKYGLVKNEDTDDPAELLVFDAVGYTDWDGNGITAENVVKFLKDNNEKDIIVRINSPGGLAFEGITIHNALLQHEGFVTTRVEGIAASAASVIAVAGDEVEIMENGSIMIHRAWNIVIGNQHDLRDTADFLDKLDEQIITTFAAKTGLAKDEIRDLMDGNRDGTTFDAEESVEKGFADKLVKIKTKRKSKKKKDKDSDAEDATERARNYLQLQANARLREFELHRHSENS